MKVWYCYKKHNPLFVIHFHQALGNSGGNDRKAGSGVSGYNYKVGGGNEDREASSFNGDLA